MPEDITKSTWRMPKQLLKELKMYAIEHEKSLTEVAEEAFKEYLVRHKK